MSIKKLLDSHASNLVLEGIDMPTVRGYAAPKARAPLEPFSFMRREPGDKDVRIEISHCGICHSDVHQARDEWGGAVFPMVPGHEIVGRVVQVGRKVSRFKVGDTAGVGCLVDTCRSCENCRRGLEQHCLKLPSFTYNGVEQDGKTPTFGGYSESIVVDERFVLQIASGLPHERVAPLLCAGITTYSPLKRWGAGRGRRVGVMGLGGLGHMAVKIAAAMGSEITVFSGSAAKRSDAAKLGAAEFVLASDEAALQKTAGRLDLIIDTISAEHDVNSVLGLLRTEGTLVMVGASPAPLTVGTFPLILGRRNLAGSLIGGLPETQEMLDFCAQHGVLSDVEVVAAQDVNAAYERMLKGDVRYRFVVDLKTL